jgi:hypothetical protein
MMVDCDKSNSIQYGWQDWQNLLLSTKHADLIQAIWVLKHKLPILVTFEHVFGHQDDRLSFDALPQLAKLNVIMDHHAKVKLLALHEHSPPPHCPAPLLLTKAGIVLQ